MHLLPLPARRWDRSPVFAFVHLTAVVLFSLVVVGLTDIAFGQVVLPQQFNGRGDRPQPADQDVISGVYLPTDRTLSRAVTRARERLADHEYQEALAFLHGILGRDEDSFLERSGEERGQLGLKSTSRQMIGDLPPAGLDAYELLQGPTARRQLEAALKSGDRNALAKVVRQFFHTSAGYEASLVLAQMEADQGHRLAAAQLYQELIDAPRAAARFEPQLSIAAAINHMAAGQSAEAAATLKALVEKKPASEITLSGKTVTLPSLGADPLAWLANLVGDVKAATPSDNNWLTLRGDPSRNVQSPGGEPHLRPRWEARVVNDPSIESFLAGRTKDFLQRGVVAIPGARPIAIGDTVVMRTPENVVAIDWQTGKRVWETRDEEELDTDDVPSDLDPGVDQEQIAAQGRPLEERMWDDALATSLSSDGSRVFVVRGLQSRRDDESVPWQVVPGIGRMGALATATATNQLAAYDLATQGKLAWELDGGRDCRHTCRRLFPRPSRRDRQHALRNGRDSKRPLSLGPRSRNRSHRMATATRRSRTRHRSRSDLDDVWAQLPRTPAGSSSARPGRAPSLGSTSSNASSPGCIATLARHKPPPRPASNGKCNKRKASSCGQTINGSITPRSLPRIAYCSRRPSRRRSIASIFIRENRFGSAARAKRCLSAASSMATCYSSAARPSKRFASRMVRRHGSRRACHCPLVHYRPGRATSAKASIFYHSRRARSPKSK